ncbi:MAG: cytochrome c3 family protein [Planctomycetota bacterium]
MNADDPPPPSVAWYRRPQLWVAVCSAVLVTTLGVVGKDRKSPGPLAAAHARVAELAGGASCSECHGGWFQDMSSACLDCHEAIESQMDDGRGLHGRLAEDRRACASCHSDHHGANFAMVNDVSFRKAGVPNVDAFDHSLVGFDMDGKHVELACTDCHAHAFDEVVPEGVTRFTGLSQRCAACHEDEHHGAFGQDCASCHVQESFTEHVATFHDDVLPLIGGHGGMDCRACHAEGEVHSLEVVAGNGSKPTARACLDCHDSPHGEAFVTRNARDSRTSLEASCVVCHAAAHTSFRDEALEITAEQHAASGFPLALPHDEVTCDGCHAPEPEDFAARYPGRDADRCAACHEDPHGGQFATGPFAQEGCVACHGRERFEPHGFTAELHARAALPLEGGHLGAACEDCHTVAHDGEPRTFRGTSDTCSACHEDAHNGFFDSRTQALEPVAHGDCARCHGATAFAQLVPESFDHTRWTGFPVDGAHEAEGCASCHASTAEPDAAGRTFGRVAPEHGELVAMHAGPEVGRSCAACHEDPHGGRFDAEGLPERYDEREGCARCHTDASFRDLSRGFDHGLWTGFPLDGAHGEQSCSTCHAPLRAPTTEGRTWGFAKGADCASCHADPHGGQFRERDAQGTLGATDCARCHQNTTSFAKLRFRHNWDSRFKLDETHAKVDCAQCHRPEVISGAPTFHYKPLGTNCTDCHGVGASSLRKDG